MSGKFPYWDSLLDGGYRRGLPDHYQTEQDSMSDEDLDELYEQQTSRHCTVCHQLKWLYEYPSRVGVKGRREYWTVCQKCDERSVESEGRWKE